MTDQTKAPYSLTVATCASPRETREALVRHGLGVLADVDEPEIEDLLVRQQLDVCRQGAVVRAGSLTRLPGCWRISLDVDIHPDARAFVGGAL